MALQGRKMRPRDRRARVPEELDELLHYILYCPDHSPIQASRFRSCTGKVGDWLDFSFLHRTGAMLVLALLFVSCVLGQVEPRVAIQRPSSVATALAGRADECSGKAP